MVYLKKTWITVTALCLLSIAGFVFAQMQIDEKMPPTKRLEEKIIYIPQGKLVKTAALGYDAVLADLLWMRTVMYFGQHFVTDKDYRWLYSMLDAVTTLDPGNILAYRFGGNILALEAGEVDSSIRLLQKGIRNNPDKGWRLYFLLGFDYFYLKNDYLNAAKNLEKASRMPGHPQYLPRLAAKMYAEANQADVALAFLREIYDQYQDESVRAAVAQEMNEIMAKKQIGGLEQAADRYKRIYGVYPKELSMLVTAGIIRQLPQFDGGEYKIDPHTGKVDWVSSSKKAN